ncbi:MFS transporter [Chromobacterium sp. IIBBL 290-4]|uniref:MFS transporter n=1 Tax=Chromobacterium sp. IIBBL 290-4 TaxID=2953890 RepID=UPI0020B80567|nr:MFS transporter [Chromobacterium sp. IIBBL 290-4]UTH75615.1 MFS transporter [Chromobacterium sp. IIBBL 290-4]
MHAPPPALNRDALSHAHRVLRALLLADGLLSLASLAEAAVLPWWIANQGGASALAGFGAAMAAATFAAVLLAAPLGDKWGKSAQIGRASCLLAILGAALAGLATHSGFRLDAVLLLGCAQMLVWAFADQARNTILAERVAAEALPQALRWRKTGLSLSGILGPLLAAAGVRWLGISGALWMAAGLYLLAGLAMAWVPGETSIRRQALRPRAWMSELAEGFRAKWRMPMERGWTLVNFVLWIFQGPSAGMLIPLKAHALGLSGDWLGNCLAALSLGVLLGSAFGSQWLAARLGRYRVRLGVGLLEGLAFAAAGFAPSGAWLLGALLAAGFCNAAMSLVGATHRSLALPKDYRVRLYAVSALCTQTAGAIGPALVGAALLHWSVGAVYGAAGLLMMASVPGMLWVPRFREFLTLNHEQATDWYRREYPQVFGEAVQTRSP